MMKVIILYHPDFSSKGKFERKLARIFSNVKDYRIIYFDDSNSLIGDYFDSNLLIKVDLELLANPFSIGPTHAIIFDSATNPVFSDTREVFSEKIPVRYIKDNITFVSNKDKGDHFDTYIGRGTLWGNPYAIGHDGDRDEVIRKFKYDFERDFLRGGAEFREKLHALRGHTLGCHCKPYACHGDILARYLNEIDDGQ